MAIIRYIDATGAPVFREWADDAERPDGAVEVDRLPGPFEDFVDGEWIYDAKGHADRIAGPAHIAEAHLLKFLEALAIKGGASLAPGLLDVEAKEKQVPIITLAEQVIEKRAAFVAKEVARQRAQGGGG